MNHLIKAILWLAFALIMAFCCVIDVILQNWFGLVICIVAFVFDILDASIEFSTWAREQGKRAARKTEEDDDT